MEISMWIFPLGAGVVSAIFCLQLVRQWRHRRGPHLAAWAVALAMFACASVAVAVGLLAGWNPFWFRVYYLFGAIVNVPVLGLGTVFLLLGRRAGWIATAVVVPACFYAGAQVATADLNGEGLEIAGIPSGRDVAPQVMRALSRYYSLTGSVVVVGGAVWSAARLATQRDKRLKRLAVANSLIGLGTLVVALGSAFARYGAGSVFAVGLFVGVSLMFMGFLRTRPRASPARPSDG